MNYTLCVLLLGVGIVVGCILWLRLHAFLALILASFVVAALTPAAVLDQFYLGDVGFSLNAQSEDGALQIQGNANQFEPGDRLTLIEWDPTTGKYHDIGSASVNSLQAGDQREQIVGQLQLDDNGVLPLKGPLSHYRVVPRVTLQQARKLSRTGIGTRVATGFGDACMKVGLIIAMASIIGTCLLDSGAADRIVRSALRLFGEKSAPTAFVASGFLLAVPVFFDTVFLLMIPLGKALRIRTGRNYLLYVLAIVCGGTMAHSLVPPTPGPLTVSEELGVNLGVMMVGGFTVGLGTASFGLLCAYILNRYYELPLRESADVSLAELEAMVQRPDASLPPLWFALTPIVLPIVLITSASCLQGSKCPSWLPETAWNAFLAGLDVLGDKNICLTLAAVVSIIMLVRQRQLPLRDLAGPLQGALASAGVITLVTSAGGAFGLTLRQTGVADLIETLPNSSPVLLCSLAFLLTVAIRTAQGSATVAMMTSAGILSGIVHGGQLGFHPLYLALAIGCGSKPIMWMNDSGFLVMTRMSGMTDNEGLKYLTTVSAAMGVFGLLLTLLGVTLWPGP